ncbi:3'(2'),5'-bisphosphate nucleotidase CysQ [Rhodococcus sp. NPDC060090]|uniref:3'(2'),5'-bisphosphate nucleotidase CysQ n=1 Tax=Rhodococcus sp. NPDC060090 TaxID=3347056 RepID=UPI0036654F63
MDHRAPVATKSTPPVVNASDTLAATELATGAGELLLELRLGLEAGGADPDEIRRMGDLRSHEWLVRALEAKFPEDAVLSEEGADDLARLGSDRIWIVDPLDGTREYGESGRTDWAVHVALVESGLLTAGAVAMPALGVTYSTGDTPSISSPQPRTPRVVVSRTRKPEPVLALASALGGELVEMGSAGAKAMAVVRGEVDIYAHTGGQYEWDSAAPVAVARAAGLHVSRIDGSEPRYNQENPWMPDMLICRPELAGEVLEVLGR